MNILVIDLTHGGVKIAVSLAKKGKSVYCYDIYNTLKDIDRRMLDVYNVKLIQLKDLKDFTGDLKVIYPIHLPLTNEDIRKNNENLNYTFITHHEAVAEILDGWGKDIKKIEITGVKGKTSCAFMLKEILIDENPLVLSSLGALLYVDKKEIVLQKNISIAPSNIKETVDLANKLANPLCNGESKNQIYNSAIFESSLGTTGIGDVGLLTNIVEDYPIAQNKSSASIAKKQVFRCGIICCEKESLDKYYKDIEHEKVNSFSFDDESADLYVKNVEYSLDETIIDIAFNDIKTKSDDIISGEIQVKTFAPGKHHVLNVLGVVGTALSLNIDENTIINGLKNYKGIAGRTNKKNIENITVIEEINPGINTKAIEASINMIDNDGKYIISIGGDYGITCEEIDEDTVAKLIDTLDKEIILTGEVGKSILNKINKKVNFIEDYNAVYDFAIENNRNLLFIYRSDYKKLSKR
ncbi:MAG: coenzyme F430 synthase [Methanobrevibacter millerae]|uniref:Coenzyme F430 synthase n=1 Tax=Methanobrevibacter millerae TaxID=230361 RepID=A0A8T3VK88_9EURY|nr:coenzyme F430 synthase [Methanobrevibacter millerae]MBE6504584.1 coenzyme F430 synthase [Methanobrevibacter millerae]